MINSLFGEQQIFLLEVGAEKTFNLSQGRKVQPLTAESHTFEYRLNNL